MTPRVVNFAVGLLLDGERLTKYVLAEKAPCHHRTAQRALSHLSGRVDLIINEAVGSDLSSWEKHQFLPSIRGVTHLSTKQYHILRGIEQRIFGDKEK